MDHGVGDGGLGDADVCDDGMASVLLGLAVGVLANVTTITMVATVAVVSMMRQRKRGKGEKEVINVTISSMEFVLPIRNIFNSLGLKVEDHI